MKNTLLLIFAALALMIGSFIWFVASWDATAEDSLSAVPTAPAFIWPNKLAPQGPPAAGAFPISETRT